MWDPRFARRSGEDGRGQVVFLDSNRPVFVPGERPTAIGRLVEIERTHQARSWPENSSDEFLQNWVTRDIAYVGKQPQQVAGTVRLTATSQHGRLIRLECG
jgi:hypothetical protein